MGRFLPILLGVVLIVGLTIPQINMTDRFADTNFSAKQRAELLEKVPKSFGDWRGEDKPVDPTVRDVAGAIGAVSRHYRNTRTRDEVDLWLIVGHARAISHHTPNVCYRGAGFEAHSTENSLYPMAFPGQPEATFWTNTFFKEDEVSGRRPERVFWSWYNPENEANQGQVVWEAPKNARWHFGNTRALYKMYFVSEMRDLMETTVQSACLSFARDFLPEVNKALADVHNKSETGEAPTPDVPQPATPAATAPSDSTEAKSEAADKDAAASIDQDLFGAPAETPAAAP